MAIEWLGKSGHQWHWLAGMLLLPLAVAGLMLSLVAR